MQVSCGPTSTAVISDAGELFVWGNNAGGMLGLNTSESTVPVPQHLEGLHNVVSAALGAMHGLAVIRANPVDRNEVDSG